jgi:hypothetical protein
MVSSLGEQLMAGQKRTVACINHSMFLILDQGHQLAFMMILNM